MSVCVYGLGPTGIVVSACMAEYLPDVIGYDPNAALVASLRDSTPPFHEYGLTEMITQGLVSGKLRYSHDPVEALPNAETVIVALDTPIGHDGMGNPSFIYHAVVEHLQYMRPDALVVMMSQVPVGTTRALANSTKYAYPGLRWAVSPENMRTGRAVETFCYASRVVIGLGEDTDGNAVERLFPETVGSFLRMSLESAEMAKHALNVWLALSVSYANELGSISQQTGANWADVEDALRLDPRVGEHAYVSAGRPFGGGHLGRDLNYLLDIAENLCIEVDVLRAIFPSNLAHAVRIGNGVYTPESRP